MKRTAQNPNRTLEIKEMLLTNTTIVVHPLVGNTEAIVLPDITLIDIHGSHSHVIKQIVEQIQLGIKARRNGCLFRLCGLSGPTLEIVIEPSQSLLKGTDLHGSNLVHRHPLDCHCRRT